MVALKKHIEPLDTLVPEKFVEAARRFQEAIENPKPATGYLKEMFRECRDLGKREF